jgi:pimeloyl-ACP methyl ester carboxylesterase
MYRSELGKEAIQHWYNQQQQQYGYKSHYVDTRYGKTHCLVAGETSSPSLLLLPGTNFSALSWHEHIKPLSDSFRVIAVDIVGQPGKSSDQRLRFKDDSYAEWLLDLLDGLDTNEAHVVGHSLGGWIGLKTASIAPKRIAKLVLIGSAGLVPLRISPEILLKSISFVFFPNQRTSTRLLQMMSVQPPPADMVTWMELVGKHVKSSLAPPPLQETELQQIEAAIMLITGEKDVFVQAEHVAMRAKQVLNKPKTIIVPDTGHLLPDEQPEKCVAYIKTFFKQM